MKSPKKTQKTADFSSWFFINRVFLNKKTVSRIRDPKGGASPRAHTVKFDENQFG
jgi:hypothetical protein